MPSCLTEKLATLKRLIAVQYDNKVTWIINIKCLILTLNHFYREELFCIVIKLVNDPQTHNKMETQG